MSKTAKSLVVCLLLLTLVGASAFAKQEVEKHTFHFGLNPFSWIYGVYKGEVGIPLTGLVELAGQFTYVDRGRQAAIYGVDLDAYWKRLNAGLIVHIFPNQMATGFFISGRLSYLRFTVVDEIASTEDVYDDATAGVDIGWRYIWEFENGWGMFLQFYGGAERFFFNGEISDEFFPILPVTGFHFGFLM
jgi:hypothetical protein